MPGVHLYTLLLNINKALQSLMGMPSGKMGEVSAVPLTKAGKKRNLNFQVHFKVSGIFASCWGSVPLSPQSHLVPYHLGAGRYGLEESQSNPTPDPCPPARHPRVPFNLVLRSLLTPWGAGVHSLLLETLPAVSPACPPSVETQPSPHTKGTPSPGSAADHTSL